jgi:hypothetical protein
MPHGKTVGVSVEIRQTGGKKGTKKPKQSYEVSKGSNYDLLLALGFDRTLIDQNKKLGLKEKNARDLNAYLLEHAQQIKDGNVEMEHSKEVKAQIYEK